MDITSDDHDQQEYQGGPSTSKRSRFSTRPRLALGNLINAQPKPRLFNARDSIGDLTTAQSNLSYKKIYFHKYTN